jgi:hypothetical protein
MRGDMLTQEEKAAMMEAFDAMSDHDQVAIYGLIHDRASSNSVVREKRRARLLRDSLGNAENEVLPLVGSRQEQQH